MKIVTAKELAKILKVSPATIYRMADDREIPFLNVRTGYRFKLDDVLNTLEMKARR